MRSRTGQFLAAFLACWMPFCCCQVRAAAMAVAHVAHADDGDRDHRPACCRAQSAEPACDAERHDGCCDEAGGDRGAPAKGTCCVSCKDRSLPPAVQGDLLPAISVDFVATAVLADGWAAQADAGAPEAGRHDRGPPPLPGGRAALALHSVLVI